MSEEKLLRLPEVLNLVGVKKSSWWKWVATGYAPKSIRIGNRCTMWKASDIQNFIQKAIAQSEANNGM